MECRPECGACCIAPSISSAIPGMPNGKPAGERCVQLLDDARCAIFGSAERPDVCRDFMPDIEICGDTKQQAIDTITFLEIATHSPSLLSKGSMNETE